MKLKVDVLLENIVLKFKEVLLYEEFGCSVLSCSLIIFMYIFSPEIRKVYRSIDTNGDNQLSADEILRGAHLLGINPTREEVTSWMSETDKDGVLTAYRF